MTTEHADTGAEIDAEPTEPDTATADTTALDGDAARHTGERLGDQDVQVLGDRREA